jgi:hypothetical protein
MATSRETLARRRAALVGCIARLAVGSIGHFGIPAPGPNAVPEHPRSYTVPEIMNRASGTEAIEIGREERHGLPSDTTEKEPRPA